MIILLDTSTSVCDLTIVDEGKQHNFQWDAGRTLARGLHEFMKKSLEQIGGDWQSISGIGVMQGPGSFTGLRIGLTVANTLADSLEQPIVGVQESPDWKDQALNRLNSGDNDRLVMPFYGSEANITLPRR